MQDVDDGFYHRADEHINLSNDQVSEKANQGEVSASMMFSVARYNAYISACGCKNSEELLAAKEKAADYFSTEYRKMFVENIENYIENFDQYMK